MGEWVKHEKQNREMCVESNIFIKTLKTERLFSMPGMSCSCALVRFFFVQIKSLIFFPSLKERLKKSQSIYINMELNSDSVLI